MNASPSRDNAKSAGALRVNLAVRHPECWIIELTAETGVGLLGRGVYHTTQQRANSHVTIFSDKKSELDEAVETARASGHTYSVLELEKGREVSTTTSPGDARRELLVEHDPRKQVSNAFTTRGFIYGAPVDVRSGVEHWTVMTHSDRHGIETALDEIRDTESAKIELIGITEVDARPESGELPLFRLSPRQREVFQHAQRAGYYAHPKETTAGDLARELNVTTSTIHEHLHKAEQKLLDLTN